MTRLVGECSRYWLLLLLIALYPAALVAQDDLAARFKREAPVAWAELVKKWSPAWIEVDSTCSGGDKDGTHWTFSDQITVKVAGTRRLVVVSRGENTQSPWMAGQDNVSCVNGGREFQLQRKESDWAIRSLGDATERDLESMEKTEAVQIRVALTVINRPIDRIVENGSFVVERAEPSTSEGRPAVRVHFAFRPHPSEQANLRRGWVDLLPELSWVVGGFRTWNRTPGEDENGPGLLVIEGVRHYRPESKGTDVVIERAEQRNAGPAKDGREFSSHCVWKYKRFDLTAAPNSDFELAAFGINMPLEPESVSPLRRGALWLTAAVVLVLAAAWLYRRSKVAE